MTKTDHLNARIEALELLVARMATLFRDDIADGQETQMWLLDSLENAGIHVTDSSPDGVSDRLSEDLTDEDVAAVLNLRIPRPAP